MTFLKVQGELGADTQLEAFFSCLDNSSTPLLYVMTSNREGYPVSSGVNFILEVGLLHH